MSNLNLPVPEGGNALSMVVISSDGHELIDGPHTPVATGATGDVTAIKYTTGATALPNAATPYWLYVGKDGDGNGLYVPCYKCAV